MRVQDLLKPGLFTVLFTSFTVTAGEVYKWIGEDGVTHYSESQPGLPADAVETVRLVPPEATPVEDASGYRAALEVARDIEASRLQRERLRLERQKLRFEQAQAAAREQREDPETARYYPVYPYYYRYPHKPRWPRGHYPHRGPEQWPDRQPGYPPPGGGQARLPGMGTR